MVAVRNLTFSFVKKFKVLKIVSWLLTILFVHFTWVVFRSHSVEQAKDFITLMMSPAGDFTFFNLDTINLGMVVKSIFIILLICLNSDRVVKLFKPTIFSVVFLAIISTVIFYKINNQSIFLYFNF